jgi:hypothetical protein
MKLNKKVSKRIFKFVLASSLFGAGVLIGKFSSFSSFTIGKEINLVEVSSIFVTVFAAWYISVILEAEKEEGRTEKNLILKRTEEVYQLVDKGQQRATTGSIPLQEVISHLKRVHVSLTSISKILVQTRIKTDETVRKQIVENTKRLRNLLTNTPVAGANSTISVTDGIVMLSQSRINEIESEYDKLKDNILLLEISINKA